MSIRELNKFKSVTKIDVRWGDMDAFQHVNNTVYARWAEIARVEYLTQHIIGKFDKKKLGPILARQDIRYIFPITFPDTVSVGFKTIEILEDRIICECRVYSNNYKKLSAIIYNTIMPYNFKTLSKSKLPKQWVNKIKAVDFTEVKKTARKK